jgi:hypothetical protein
MTPGVTVMAHSIVLRFRGKRGGSELTKVYGDFEQSSRKKEKPGNC